MPVNSPCVRNCCLDKKDVCIGCGRTVEEIDRWGCDVDDKEKRKILAAVEKRKSSKGKYETI